MLNHLSPAASLDLLLDGLRQGLGQHHAFRRSWTDPDSKRLEQFIPNIGGGRVGAVTR